MVGSQPLPLATLASRRRLVLPGALTATCVSLAMQERHAVFLLRVDQAVGALGLLMRFALLGRRAVHCKHGALDCLCHLLIQVR